MAKATDIPASARKALAERDGGRCRGCGQQGVWLHAHHIRYRSQSRNDHSLGNLIQLCAGGNGHPGCHRLAHAYPNQWRDALLEVAQTEHLTAMMVMRRQGVDLRQFSKGAI